MRVFESLALDPGDIMIAAAESSKITGGPETVLGFQVFSAKYTREN